MVTEAKILEAAKEFYTTKDNTKNPPVDVVTVDWEKTVEGKTVEGPAQTAIKAALTKVGVKGDEVGGILDKTKAAEIQKWGNVFLGVIGDAGALDEETLLKQAALAFGMTDKDGKVLDQKKYDALEKEVKKLSDAYDKGGDDKGINLVNGLHKHLDPKAGITLVRAGAHGAGVIDVKTDPKYVDTLAVVATVKAYGGLDKALTDAPDAKTPEKPKSEKPVAVEEEKDADGKLILHKPLLVGAKGELVESVHEKINAFFNDADHGEARKAAYKTMHKEDFADLSGDEYSEASKKAVKSFQEQYNAEHKDEKDFKKLSVDGSAGEKTLKALEVEFVLPQAKKDSKLKSDFDSSDRDAEGKLVDLMSKRGLLVTETTKKTLPKEQQDRAFTSGAAFDDMIAKLVYLGHLEGDADGKPKASYEDKDIDAAIEKLQGASSIDKDKIVGLDTYLMLERAEFEKRAAVDTSKMSADDKNTHLAQLKSDFDEVNAALVAHNVRGFIRVKDTSPIVQMFQGSAEDSNLGLSDEIKQIDPDNADAKFNEMLDNLKKIKGVSVPTLTPGGS